MHRYLLNFKVKSLMNLYQNDPLFHLISNATVIICNTSRFTAVSAVGACRYSTHKFYMKEKISEIVRDFCDLLLKVKTFQKVSSIIPFVINEHKHCPQNCSQSIVRVNWAYNFMTATFKMQC